MAWLRVLWARLNPARWSPPARAFAAAALCFALFAGLTVGVVAYQITSSQHSWCQLLGTLTLPQPPHSPPLTKRGQEVVQELHDLQRGLGC